MTDHDWLLGLAIPGDDAIPRVVIVGQGVGLYTDDLVTFTESDLDTVESTSSRCVMFYETDDEFIAAGFFGSWASSPEGEVWTQEEASMTGAWDATVNDFEYVDTWSLWIAVVESNTGAGTPARIITSPDKTAWTQRVSLAGAFSSAFPWGLTYSPSLDMAAMCSDQVAAMTDPLRTTINGTAWTARNPNFPVANVNLKDVEWLFYHAKFLAVGSDGRYTVSDAAGTTYTAGQIAGFGTDDIWAIGENPNTGQVLVGGENGKIYRTTNLSAWTSVVSPFGTSRVTHIEWYDEFDAYLLLAEGGKIATSADGVTVTLQTSPTTRGLNESAIGLVAA